MRAQCNAITKQLRSLTHSPNATVEIVVSACVVSNVSELDLPILKFLFFNPTTNLGLTTVKELNVSIDNGSVYQTLTTSFNYTKNLFLYNQNLVVIPPDKNSTLFVGFAPPDSSTEPFFQTIPQYTDQETALDASKQKTYGKIKYYKFSLTPVYGLGAVNGG